MKTRTKRFGSILSAGILLGALSGCDDPNSSAMRPKSRQNAAGASAVASNQASDSGSSGADVAAYPMKPPSVLLIDGNEIEFPAAKLAVHRHGSGGYLLYLCSDDPPTAINPNYAGNSYVLDLWVPIDRLSDLPGFQMDFKPTADDSVSGIFLHGYHHEQIRPLAAHLLFQKDGDAMLISITGQCERTDPRNPAARPQRVTLSAHLRVSELTD